MGSFDLLDFLKEFLRTRLCDITLLSVFGYGSFLILLIVSFYFLSLYLAVLFLSFKMNAGFLRFNPSILIYAFEGINFCRISSLV